MKYTLSTSQAVDRLLADEYAGWTYKGATALVDYLENLEGDLDEDIEMDVTAIRCEYSEYGSCKEAAVEYGFDDPEDELKETFREDLIEEYEEEELEEKIELEAYIARETEKRLPALLEDEEDDMEEKAREWLEDQTSVILFDGGVIIQDF